MMESSSPAAADRNRGIAQLNSDDVLLGRGPALSNYEGNLRFHALVDRRKGRYKATPSRKKKGEIAREVLDLIHERGGRFLKQNDRFTSVVDSEWFEVETAVSEEKIKQALREPEVARTKKSKGTKRKESSTDETSSILSSLESITSDGSASVMASALEATISNAGVAMESQAPILFQETVTPPSTFQGLAASVGESSVMDTLWSTPEYPLSAGSVASNAAVVSPPFALASSLLPLHPTLQAPNAAALPPVPPITPSSFPSSIEPRLLLFQSAPLAAPPQSIMTQSVLLNQVLRSQLETSPPNNGGQEILQALLHSANAAAEASHQQFVATNAMCSLMQNFARLQSNSQQAVGLNRNVTQGQSNDEMDIDEKEDRKPAAATNKATVPEERRLSDSSIDEELSAFLLSWLAMSDRPVVTEEQEALEFKMMTDTEKATWLSDVFGKMLEEFDDGPPDRKRQRLDLDRGFVAFLVNQMRLEIENIPEIERRALMDAQASTICRRDEFSDARLEKFLRCEGMNTKVRFARGKACVSLLLVTSLLCLLYYYSWRHSALLSIGRDVGKCSERTSIY